MAALNDNSRRLLRRNIKKQIGAYLENEAFTAIFLSKLSEKLGSSFEQKEGRLKTVSLRVRYDEIQVSDDMALIGLVHWRNDVDISLKPGFSPGYKSENLVFTGIVRDVEFTWTELVNFQPINLRVTKLEMDEDSIKLVKWDVEEEKQFF